MLLDSFARLLSDIQKDLEVDIELVELCGGGAFLSEICLNVPCKGRFSNMKSSLVFQFNLSTSS